MHQAKLGNLYNDMASLNGQSWNHCPTLSTVPVVGVIFASWYVENKFREFCHVLHLNLSLCMKV